MSCPGKSCIQLSSHINVKFWGATGSLAIATAIVFKEIIGLKSHGPHDIAKKYLKKDFGGTLSVGMADGARAGPELMER